VLVCGNNIWFYRTDMSKYSWSRSEWSVTIWDLSHVQSCDTRWFFFTKNCAILWHKMFFLLKKITVYVKLTPTPLFAGALCYRAKQVKHLKGCIGRIYGGAPFPPISSRGARSCRVHVSLPISTTEETHETRCRVGPLASFSSLYYEGVYMFLI
jgi:hypothetical protein